MKSLAQLFQGVPIGGVCTGTVHYYKLDVKKLLKANVIRIEKNARLESSETSKGSNPCRYDYIFQGFDNFPKLEKSKD